MKLPALKGRDSRERSGQIPILNAYILRKFNGLNIRTKAQAWFANLFKDRCQDHLKLSLIIPVDMRKFMPACHFNNIIVNDTSLFIGLLTAREALPPFRVLSLVLPVINWKLTFRVYTF